MSSDLFSLSNDEAAGVSELLNDFASLMTDRSSSDVVFLVSSSEVPVYAHRLILATRCSGLRSLRLDSVSSSPTSKASSSSTSSICIKYPQFDVDTFRQVIAYIYTGRLSLQETSSFRVLSISRHFGIRSLTSRCEHYVITSLSLHNACAFYTAALQLDEETAQHQHTELRHSPLTEQCGQFIEQNASQCVHTEGWLELPKHILTTILSSDSFALEEEDVWRAVLRWAKYHAGVPLDKPTHTWSEHDKTLVCQALSGVIEHVKLLVIDSTVFAEEVEPTGAVPMELSLERYRYAALSHNQLHNSPDRRLCPRISSELFPDSRILCGALLHHQRTLNMWYGDLSQQWTLLYRASIHGYNAQDFHARCDGYAPTIVVIQGNTGNVCGGFTDVPWTNKAPARGRFVTSNKCFLFTLHNKQGIPATKFPVSKPQCATVHHPNFGPVFGAGADLSIASHCQSGMECYSNLGHSYGGPTKVNPRPQQHANCSTLMGDYNFNVKDYEVFTITAPHAQREV